MIGFGWDAIRGIDTLNWRERRQRPTALGDEKNRPEGVPMHKTNDVEPDYLRKGKKQ